MVLSMQGLRFLVLVASVHYLHLLFCSAWKMLFLFRNVAIQREMISCRQLLLSTALPTCQIAALSSMVMRRDIAQNCPVLHPALNKLEVWHHTIPLQKIEINYS